MQHSCLAPTKKWPYPGETLPVTFDRADPDRLADLERLAKLRESGALTEEEFEREKARILGS